MPDIFSGSEIVELKQIVPEQGREAVDELIRQEQKHLSTLLGLKVLLT